MHRNMKSIRIPIAFMALCLTVCAVSGSYYSETKAAKLKKEKVTHLRFYLRDTLSGLNPSAVRIAGANVSGVAAESPVGFGSLFAMDDPLTVGPEKDSKEIGNGRGMYVSGSRDIKKKFTIVMYVDLEFTRGKWKGSSISVFSRNPVAAGEREIAIVGGRGKFRMARGFVKIKTHQIDMKTGDALLRYDATVFHY